MSKQLSKVERKNFLLTGTNLSRSGPRVGGDLMALVRLKRKAEKEKKEECWVVEVGVGGGAKAEGRGERRRANRVSVWGRDDRETAIAKHQSYNSKNRSR